LHDFVIEISSSGTHSGESASSRRQGIDMRKAQKQIVHRVDARDPLEKLSLLAAKNPGKSKDEVRNSTTKRRAARPGRWM
jgi:hypothetical protein